MLSGINFILRMPFPFPQQIFSPKISPMNHFKGQHQDGQFLGLFQYSSSKQTRKIQVQNQSPDLVINLLTSIPNIVIIHFLHDQFHEKNTTTVCTIFGNFLSTIQYIKYCPFHDFCSGIFLSRRYLNKSLKHEFTTTMTPHSRLTLDKIGKCLCLPLDLN